MVGERNPSRLRVNPSALLRASIRDDSRNGYQLSIIFVVTQKVIRTGRGGFERKWRKFRGLRELAGLRRFDETVECVEKSKDNGFGGRGPLRDFVLVSADCSGRQKMRGRGTLFGRIADEELRSCGRDRPIELREATDAESIHTPLKNRRLPAPPPAQMRKCHRSLIGSGGQLLIGTSRELV